VVSNLNLLSLLLAAAFLGAYVALFVRAKIQDATERRLEAAARDALDPEQMETLKRYIGKVDERERARVG